MVMATAPQEVCLLMIRLVATMLRQRHVLCNLTEQIDCAE